MKRPLLLCFLTVCCFSLLAQERKMEKSLTYTYYGVREGLVQTQAFYSFQDSYGYLWFSTNNGVSRFDGKRFKNYVNDNALTVDGRVQYIDQYREIVFFLSGAGVSLLYPDGRIEKYELPDNYRAKGNLSCVQKNHCLYIFNCDKERDLGSETPRYFFVFDFATKHYKKSTYKVPYSFAAFNTPKGIIVTGYDSEDLFGRLLLIEENNYSIIQHLYFQPGVVKKINDQSFVAYPKITSYNEITFNYLFSLKKDTFECRLIEGITAPQSVALVNNNSIYIYAPDRHSSFMIDSTLTPRPLVLETPIVNHALVDRDHNLWLSTEEGVYNCYNLLFESYKPGISRNEDIWDIKKDVFGNVWFSLYGHGIWRADTQGNLRKADYFVDGKREEIKYGYMGGCTDSINRMYLMHASGVAVFDPRKGNNTYLEGIQVGAGLISFYDTLTHTVFMSGLEYPLTNINAIDANLNRTVYNSSRSYVVSICRDGNQRLQYGTYREEGYLDEEKGVLVPDTLTERPYQVLVSMALDSAGTLWKGTDRGLFAENRSGEKRQIETEAIGLVGNYKNKYLIYGFASGPIHILELKKYYSDNQLSIRSFGYYRGVDILGCGQNGYWVDNEGYVWITAGDKGLRFLPDELLKVPDPTITSPYIASIFYSNKENEWHLLTKDSTKLRNEDNFLRFEILQAFPANPEKLQFRYRLIPYSENWQYDTNRTFTFQNLPYGNHRLEVQSSIDHVNWSDSIFSSVIIIGKPFWLTVPGLLILFLAFALVVTLIVFLVRKQVIKSQAKKREIEQLKYRAVRSKYIPHFTGNVLNSINYLIEKDKSQAQKYIVEFSHFSGQTLLNAEKIYRSLSEELDYARTYLELEKLRFEDKLEYRISVAPDVDLKLPIPAMVLQTFCENALKHGLRHKDGVGVIHIKAVVEKAYHIISVEDNGIGRKKAKEMRTEGTGEGLAIVEQQLELLYNSKNKKSFMQVIDLYDTGKLSAGTRFELHIPSDFITQ